MNTITDKPNIRQPVFRILETLGLNPDHVAKLEIDRGHVIATTYALNDDGAKFLGDDGEPVTNTTIIAITMRGEP